jgi:DNA polymerase family B/C4-type zinc-finger of DNA polymerase delta
VHLPGRSREEAFRIGREIAARVTKINPYPVTLEFEKVYHPCLLVSKKRYVGFAYEHEKQSEPVFDAKGIETVRRDACPAVSGIMKHALELFFRDPDLSKLKAYLQEQWARIHLGRFSVKDFVFANEVRAHYRSKSILPPSALVSAKQSALDPRAAALPKQRVPYVVVCGSPGARISDVVVAPEKLINPALGLRLNCQYYISRQIIPALARLFDLVGADLTAWYRELPRYSATPLRRRSTQSALTVLRPLRTARHADVHLDQEHEHVRGSGLLNTLDQQGQCGSPLSGRAALGSSGTAGGAGSTLSSTSSSSSSSSASSSRGCASNARRTAAVTIDQYYASQSCVNCGAICTLAKSLLCAHCQAEGPLTVMRMLARTQQTQRQLAQLRTVCKRCSGAQSTDLLCTSIDCPLFFERTTLHEQLAVLIETDRQLDIL